MSLLEARGLSVAFGTRDGRIDAVRSVSFDVREGECVGFVGESGSGKSQTFHAIMGLLAKNGRAGGKVLYRGTDLLSLTDGQANRLRGDRISMIFQDPLSSLTPHLKIGTQMIEVLSVHRKRSDASARVLCREWLERVRIPEAARRMEQYPHELSGGMRQRVMIAMAMLLEPELLVADEPTTALDATVQAEILDLMAVLQKENGTAIALITHDMGVVARMCDRVQVMRDGAVVEEGPVRTIFHAPRNEYTRDLLDAVPRMDRPVDRVSAADGTDSLLQVDDLHVRFSIRSKRGMFARRAVLRAVDGVSFALAARETLGIVGESGCGKSTLARAVLQLLPTHQGRVSWLGTPLTDLERREMTARRRDLQIVFQDPISSLDPRMTVGVSIAEPLRTFQPGLLSGQRRTQVSEMMERVDLDPRLINRYPHELSGGQNQRVGIARAMINGPRLVICDEAVSALDATIQAQVVALLKRLQADLGMAMIFISHDLAVVREIAHRILVLYLGRVVELGDRDAVCASPRHPYTQALISAVPVPDPSVERARSRIILRGERTSPLDRGAGLRFLPSRLCAGELDYRPQLIEAEPGHFVAEHDPLDTLLASQAASVASA